MSLKDKTNSVGIFVCDTSGSICADKLKVYKKKFDEISKIHEKLIFIKHDMVAEKCTLDDILSSKNSKGTYLSSGLKLALDTIFQLKNIDKMHNIKLYILGDGDNWSEDNLKAICYLKEIILKIGFNNINFDVIYPAKNGNSINTLIRISAEEHSMNITEMINIINEPVMYDKVIYFISHNEECSKLYSFRSEEVLNSEDMVKCKTNKGTTYGKVIDIRVITMTEENYLSYKTCKKI